MISGRAAGELFALGGAWLASYCHNVVMLARTPTCHSSLCCVVCCPAARMRAVLPVGWLQAAGVLGKQPSALRCWRAQPCRPNLPLPADPARDGTAASASQPKSAAAPDCGCGCDAQPSCGAPAAAGQSHRQHPDAEASAAGKDLQELLAGVARDTAALLQRVELPELEQLLDRRGLKCRWNCGRRASLLKLLVPALRVPLRLVPGADGEEAAGVEAPPGLESKLAKQMAPGGGSGRCAAGVRRWGCAGGCAEGCSAGCAMHSPARAVFAAGRF